MRPLLPTRGAPRSRRCLVHGGRPLRTVSQAVSLWMNHTVCARLPDIRTSAKSHNYVFSLDLEYLERSRGCRTTVVRVIRKHGRILSRCTSPIFAHWRSSNGGGDVDDRLFPARRERNRRDGLCLRRDRMRHGSRSGELAPRGRVRPSAAPRAPASMSRHRARFPIQGLGAPTAELRKLPTRLLAKRVTTEMRRVMPVKRTATRSTRRIAATSVRLKKPEQLLPKRSIVTASWMERA